MKKKTRISGILVLVLVSILTFSAPVFASNQPAVNFEGDPSGNKPNGWQSSGSSLITFSDSDGSDLFLGDFGNQGHGQSLGVFNDDTSALIMDFSIPMHSISLEFGNDQPGMCKPTDTAILTLYNGATQIDQVTVVLNGNDLMDQSISYAGASFTRATFTYSLNLIEIVDNIIFSASQDAPAGLTGISPAVFEGSDGKIQGTTTAMEFKLASDTIYTPASDIETTGLAAGTYDVRYAEKSGFAESADTSVIVLAAPTPTPTPTATPTPTPTPVPTSTPTPVPTATPTPTSIPTIAPTNSPTAAPTVTPAAGVLGVAKTGEAGNNYLAISIILALAAVGTSTVVIRRLHLKAK